ncbi:hypothetical protein WJX72_009373 [[Myrmecia] bisecta]|uniref:Uncharacterized protein n=1 Tax=[Myrmecia] bisecta TaxID=41462 RepID=A0AAW1QGG4_9CHLO
MDVDGFFEEPVREEDAPGYYDFIEHPMSAEWKSERRGVEWRCRWLELRLQELKQQERRYQRKLQRLQYQEDAQAEEAPAGPSTAAAAPPAGAAAATASVPADPGSSKPDSNPLSSGAARPHRKHRGQQLRRRRHRSEQRELSLSELLHHPFYGEQAGLLDEPAADGNSVQDVDSDADAGCYPARVYAALELLDRHMGALKQQLLAKQAPGRPGPQKVARPGKTSRGARAAALAPGSRRLVGAPAKTSLQRKDSRLGKRGRSDFDFSDMIVPGSSMGPKFVERLQVSNISIPQVRPLPQEELAKRSAAVAAWGARLKGTGPAEIPADLVPLIQPSGEGSSSEDTGDEVYVQRHAPREEEERNKFMFHSGGAQKKNPNTSKSKPKASNAKLANGLPKLRIGVCVVTKGAENDVQLQAAAVKCIQVDFVAFPPEESASDEASRAMFAAEIGEHENASTVCLPCDPYSMQQATMRWLQALLPAQSITVQLQFPQPLAATTSILTCHAVSEVSDLSEAIIFGRPHVLLAADDECEALGDEEDNGRLLAAVCQVLCEQEEVLLASSRKDLDTGQHCAFDVFYILCPAHGSGVLLAKRIASSEELLPLSQPLGPQPEVSAAQLEAVKRGLGAVPAGDFSPLDHTNGAPAKLDELLRHSLANQPQTAAAAQNPGRQGGSRTRQSQPRPGVLDNHPMLPGKPLPKTAPAPHPPPDGPQQAGQQGGQAAAKMKDKAKMSLPPAPTRATDSHSHQPAPAPGQSRGGRSGQGAGPPGQARANGQAPVQSSQPFAVATAAGPSRLQFKRIRKAH